MNSNYIKKLISHCLSVFTNSLHREHKKLLIALTTLVVMGSVANVKSLDAQTTSTSTKLQATTPSTSMLAYTPLPVPTRICDTRPGNPSGLSGLAAQCNNKTLADGESLTVAMPSSVPSNAGAVVVNLTVTDPTTAGYLTLYPAGASSPPTVSNLNFNSGQTVANLATVGLGSSSGTPSVEVYAGPSSGGGSVNVIVDLEGYYAPPSSGVEGAYYPLSPARILDTRCNENMSGQGCAGENLPSQNDSVPPLSPNSTVSFQATGVGGVPSSGVAAVVLNVTVVSMADNPLPSYLTIWPTGQPRPMASNLNFNPGEILANRVIVPVPSNGQLSVYNYSGSVQLVVDVSGWFANSAPSSNSGAYLTPLFPPERILDTRNSSPIPGGGERSLMVAGSDGIPSYAVAVVANLTDIVTSTNPQLNYPANYLTVYPANLSAPPSISDVNYTTADPYNIVPNQVYATLGTGSGAGAIDIYNGPSGVTPPTAPANVIVDVFGYFVQPVGYDISYPQCGSAFPLEAAFGIVGINYGTADTLNPCLGPTPSYPGYLDTELYWAVASSTGETTEPKASVYVNTADPGDIYGGNPITDWPTSGTTPYGPCETTSVSTSTGNYIVGDNSQACAWQYGYNLAVQDSSWLTKAANAINAQSPPVDIPIAPQSYPWWLDVETVNTWQVGSSGQEMNTADLQGMIAALRQAGVENIGVYSTSSQWNQIVGATTQASGSLYGLPDWISGASTLLGAESNCTQPSFTSGTVQLTQWFGQQYDKDYAC